MPVDWLQNVKVQIANNEIDPFDTKEDVEVLLGLTIGDIIWEELVDFHIAKQARIIQAIG